MSELAAGIGVDEGGVGRNVLLLQDGGEQQGFVLTIAKTPGEGLGGRMGLMCIDADLEAQVAYFVLYKTEGECGEAVLVAFGLGLPFGNFFVAGLRGWDSDSF
jgi:hypothetical protein